MNPVKNFQQVRAAEQAWLSERRKQAQVAPELPEIGLAFSGGGIRSACFHLGFLQALIERKKLQRVDYLSTVSGGGYIGACFQWLKHRADSSANEALFAQPVNDSNVLNWLRGHGKYLVDGKGINNMTLLAALLASTLFNLAVVLPLLLLCVWLFGFPHTQLYWPPHWHLPGADVIEGHSGYLLALFISGCSFLSFLIAVPLMALWRQSSTQHNFKPRLWMGRLLTVGVVAGLIGLLPIAAQLSDMLFALAGSESLSQLGKHINYLLPFIGGVFTLSRATLKPGLALTGLALMLYGLAAFAYHLVFHTGLIAQPIYWAFLALALLLLALASVNRTSMHSYYLSRLCNAFFMYTKADDNRGQDLPLAELTPTTGAPLPLINTTMSTASSSNRLWRERMGMSFTLTPLFCGTPATGFADTSAFQSGRLTLGESMTTSGAAVDPGTAQTANSALSFLMALLNFRLGFWTKAPKAAGTFFSHMPYWLVMREMFGIGLSETHKNIHLTDGGHFENLGVYELIRREVPIVLAGDAGADPSVNFADLGLLIQRAYADFDCHIDINTAHLSEVAEGIHNSCFAVGNITYASGKTGKLYYVKSLLTAAAGTQLASFACTDPSFPNDSTANQFYDEEHFDAYRALGKLNMLSLLEQHEADIFPDQLN
ncbi:hypothetical protein R50072_36410 [Simiduia litorea]|uniref:patatin-like phospholipase family protein n=1 Tax=Simiduia litorea TaxID=1435348 RepID=UPI0036F1FD76